jgi:plastocyanin
MVTSMSGGALRPAAALIAIASASVLVAACGGGGDDEDEGAQQPPAATGPAKTVAVTLDDFSIAPQDLTVERGATITAKNVGAVAHNFTVERGADASEDSEDLTATETFGPDSTDRLRVDLAPGRYGTVCTVGDHRELGMTGTLTVESPSG